MRTPNSPLPHRLPPPLGRPLAEALDGYPIDDLLDVAAGADEHGRAILETCLSRWIEVLDQTVEASACWRDPSQRRIHRQQIETRNALTRLREWLGSQQVLN